jgi:hypothetical protein
LLQNVVQLRLIHHPSFEACLQAWQCSRKEPKWLAARLTSGIAERGWEPSGCDVHHCTVRQDRCHWSIGHNLDGTDCQDYRLELVTVRNGMSLIPDSHASASEARKRKALLPADALCLACSLLSII